MRLYNIDRYDIDAPLICPVCGCTNVVNKLVTYSSENLNRDYMSCNSCGLVFSYPFTAPDYANSDSVNSDIAGHYNFTCYADIGAGIESMIRPLVAIMTSHFTDLDSFLDVGCGFGYCVKFANSLMGLRSIGYEPGEYGRIGSKVMNIDIVNKYFEADSSNNKYSVVFSSEVIEHVTNPYAYINTLVSVLANEGIAILTTPNNNYLHHCLERGEDTNIKTLSLLGPGQHLCLFNKKSIAFLLEKSGIANYKIFEEEENLIVYFSHGRNLETVNLCKEDIETRKHYLNFLNLLLNISVTEAESNTLSIFSKFYSLLNRLHTKFISSIESDSKKLLTRFQLGIAYRLMREFVNDGNFDKAGKIQQIYEKLYKRCFRRTVYDVLNSISTLDIEECKTPLSTLELFSRKHLSFNVLGFLFYKMNLALNSRWNTQTNTQELVFNVKKATDILSSLFLVLSDNPLALTWFGECFRLYPRFCFGLAVLYMHTDRYQDAQNLLDKLLVIQDYFAIDSRLKPDCLLQKAVIFLRKKDFTKFFACTNELKKNYPEFSNSSELLSTLLNEVKYMQS